MDNEYSSKILAVILVAVAIVAWGIFGCLAWRYVIPHNSPEKSPQGQIERYYTLIEGNSLKANACIFHYSPQVLGIMGYGLTYKEAELLNKIIECESGWRNVCNQRWGCGSGMGVAQLVPTTVRHCEKALDKVIDPFNKEDSLECASYLLTGTVAGENHWGCPTCNWGSYFCWH